MELEVLFKNKIGNKILYFEETNSTNLYAKKIASQNEMGTIVIADYQTNGYGKHQRKWFSEKGKNLTFSIILSQKNLKLELLPFLFSVAIIEVLKQNFNGNFICKWPNDILFNEKKICGTLIETVSKNGKIEFVVVGIGLNVNQKKFSNEISEIATSLSNELNLEIDRVELFKNLIQNINFRYENFLNNYNNTIEIWKSYSDICGKKITLSQNGVTLEGTAIDVNPNGELLVNINNKIKNFSSVDYIK